MVVFFDLPLKIPDTAAARLRFSPAFGLKLSYPMTRKEGNSSTECGDILKVSRYSINSPLRWLLTQSHVHRLVSCVGFGDDLRLFLISYRPCYLTLDFLDSESFPNRTDNEMDTLEISKVKLLLFEFLHVMPFS